MNFKRYLYELLLENETVIIPGFGAFISEYKPAEINTETDEIAPPSKFISFSQQIKNNDGLLVGYVAENLNISHFDALLRIEKEREDILYQLDNGEQVHFESIGTLFYTEQHTIAFTPEESENLLLDSFGLETTNISATEPEEVKEEEKEEIPAAVIPPEETEEVSVPEEAEEQIQEEETVSDIIPEEKQEEIKEEATEEIPAPEPIPEPTYSVTPVQEEEKEKKKRAWMWLLILIPLIGVSVYIFMNGDKGNSDKPKAEESSIEITEVPDTLVAQDTIQADSSAFQSQDSAKIEEPEQDAEQETEAQTPKYYLIGGSFSVEENADTYLNELKAKGIDAFHAGQKGRFYCIGIAVFNTFSEAEKAQQEYMTNNPDMELWIWRK